MIFSKIYFHIVFQNLALSCATVVLISNVRRTTKLVLLIVRYRKYSGALYFSDITLTSDFMKIDNHFTRY
jgi:hypothetical protein